MIKFLLFFVAYLFLNAYENFLRERWKYDKPEIQPYWSRKWHSIQWLRWAFIILLFAIFTIDNTLDLFILIPASVFWWIFYDGILNVMRGKSFWDQSIHHNLSYLEKYATKTTKIILFIISIIIFILIKKGVWL